MVIQKEKGGLVLRNVCRQIMDVFPMTGCVHVQKIEERLPEP